MNLPSASSQTILVVDNDRWVLRVVVAILKAAKFRVLSAASAAAAIKLAGETEQTIHLLLSDVDMPGMTGPELGAALKKTRPDLKVMLMSGGDNGLLVLGYGWTYVQKPFSGDGLVQMVENVLRSDRSQGVDGFDRRKDV